MAESANFSVFQGDSFILNITYKDADGNPVDLTDYGIACEVRDSFGGKTSAAIATLGDGIEVDLENAIISINFTPDKTKNFIVPKSVWQLQVTYPDAVTKKTIAYGVLDVKKAAVSV